MTEPGSYQLQIYPPAGFVATTEDNWAVSIANGESYTVSFGLGEAPAAVAEAAATTTGDETAAGATPGAAEAAAEDGLPRNLGMIVIGVAAVLVVLAVVGVVLLRRGESGIDATRISRKRSQVLLFFIRNVLGVIVALLTLPI